MSISKSISTLKSEAKKLKKATSMTHIESLDFLAKQHGFESWSLLQSQYDFMEEESLVDVLRKSKKPLIFLVKGSSSQALKNFFYSLAHRLGKEQMKSCYFSSTDDALEISKKILEKEANFSLKTELKDDELSRLHHSVKKISDFKTAISDKVSKWSDISEHIDNSIIQNFVILIEDSQNLILTTSKLSLKETAQKTISSILICSENEVDSDFEIIIQEDSLKNVRMVSVKSKLHFNLKI